MFGSPHTSNQFYLLRNCFSKFVYLKDMYIILKVTGKILLVSVLRICKFLNFTAVFTKKVKLFKVFIQFSAWESLFQSITIHSFWRTLLRGRLFEVRHLNWVRRLTWVRYFSSRVYMRKISYLREILFIPVSLHA